MELWESWKKGFDLWENATARYTAQVLRSPWILGPGGLMLGAVTKARSAADEAVSGCWSRLGLATRRDQERTLHTLHQIESRLMDLEERVAKR